MVKYNNNKKQHKAYQKCGEYYIDDSKKINQKTYLKQKEQNETEQ